MTVPGLTVAVRRWALTLAAMAVLSVLVAVVVGVAGLFGFAAVDTGGGDPVPATVIAGAPCSEPGSKETVRLTLDGKQREASLDACGHTENDALTVTVPRDRATGPGGDLLVHSAEAAPGVDDAWRPIGLCLLFLAGLAGGGYALLYLRKPGERLPRLPWVTSSP